MNLALMTAFCVGIAVQHNPFIDYERVDPKTCIAFKFCKRNVEDCSKKHGGTCYEMLEYKGSGRFVLHISKENKP